MTQHATISPTKQDPTAIARLNDLMQQAGQAANEQAARVAFADHTARKQRTPYAGSARTWHYSRNIYNPRRACYPALRQPAGMARYYYA